MKQVAMPRKIIVCAPGDTRTGGPEALHQFAHAVNRTRLIKAEIFYLGDLDPSVIQNYYAKYSVPRCESTTSAHSVVVIPEYVDPKTIRVASGSIIFVWWLSATRNYPIDHYSGCRHVFQSRHAQQTLRRCGMDGELLTDYISVDAHAQIDTRKAKRNLVAYNGAKSALVGSRLMLEDSSLKLVPIRNMTGPEVVALLRKAKVYVDFGPHPGKDRLPREAALADCIIFTNKRGSAANLEDLPIPERYKLSSESPQALQKAIRNAFDNYETYIGDFANYREAIAQQQGQFNVEVRQFLESLNVSRPNACVNPAKLDDLDLLYLEQKKELTMLEHRANEFALEVEKLLGRGTNAIRLKNDFRKIYNRIRSSMG